MSAGPSQQSAATAIVNAASKYGVPVTLLAGVYGRESSFGTAYGPGQKTYGYFGLTSPGLWNPSMTLQQSADTAAQTLSNLYKQTKSWNAATLAYSNSAYNATDAQSTAATNHGLLSAIATAIVDLPTGTSAPPGVSGPGGVAGALDSAATSTGTAVSTAANATKTVGQFLGDLTKLSTWLRVVEVIGGLALIILSLRQFASAVGVHAPKVMPVPV